MQGGKNRRRGKNEGEEKRELIQKEEDQGEYLRANALRSLAHSCAHLRFERQEWFDRR